jgi:hypothetical protein
VTDGRSAATTRYLLVESRGPWSGPGCAAFVRDAAVLARAGNDVRLVLIQDAVCCGIPGAGVGVGVLNAAEVDDALDAGVRVVADRFSAQHRGLLADNLRDSVRMVEMADIARWALDPDVRVVWH